MRCSTSWPEIWNTLEALACLYTRSTVPCCSALTTTPRRNPYAPSAEKLIAATLPPVAVGFHCNCCCVWAAARVATTSRAVPTWRGPIPAPSHPPSAQRPPFARWPRYRFRRIRPTRQAPHPRQRPSATSFHFSFLSLAPVKTAIEHENNCRNKPASALPGQRLQRQFDAIAYTHLWWQGLEGRRSLFVVVAQSQQCLQNVGLCVTGSGPVGSAHVGPQLALELQQQPLGRLLANARHLDQAACLLQRDSLGQIRHAHAAQDGQRSARPHARYLDQLAERLALGRRGKAIQQLRVFAHNELGQQAHLFAHSGQVVERAHGHIHLIAHAMAVQQHLGGILLQQGAGQFAYH